MVENSIVSRIFQVFTELIEWFTTDAMPAVSDMFYTSQSGLTLFGTLAILGLGIGIVFLLVNVIKSMLHLR